MLRKVLRGIGIALILMPEPFTTPIGLLLLGMAFLLARSRKLNSRPYLRGLIKLYLNHTRPHSQPAKIIHHNLDARLAELNSLWHPPLSIKVTHHVIDDDRLRLKYGTRLNAARKLGDEATGRQGTSRNTVHHSLESRWSSYDWPRQPSIPDDGLKNTVPRRLEESPFVRAMTHSPTKPEDSQRSDASQKADKVIHHSLADRLSGYVLPSVPIVPEKTVQHAVDMSRLQPYYERKLAELASRDSTAPGNGRKPERIILRRAGWRPAQTRTGSPWAAKPALLQPSYN